MIFWTLAVIFAVLIGHTIFELRSEVDEEDETDH